MPHPINNLVSNSNLTEGTIAFVHQTQTAHLADMLLKYMLTIL